MKKPTIYLLFLINISLFGQSFEGYMRYKIELKNIDNIQSSDWNSQIEYLFGEKGYMVQSYYYSDNKYFSEISIKEDKSYQLYDSHNKILYSWFSDNSNIASKIDTQKFKDIVVDVEYLKENETILNIKCSTVIMTFESGKVVKLWYNRDFFKTNNSMFIGHGFNNLEQIINELNCLPIKIEEKSQESWAVQTMIEYEEKEIDKEKFKLPSFDKIVNDNEGR